MCAQHAGAGGVCRAAAKLRRMDLEDAKQKRALLGKTAYKARIRRVIKSVRAQEAAANCAKRFRKVCRRVVQVKGAASGF